MAEPLQSSDPFRPPTSALGGAEPPYAFGWEKGFEWIGQAYRLFARDPIVWIAVLFAFFVMQLLLSLVPIIGSLANSFTSVVFLAGILIGCSRLASGTGMRFESLFAAFGRPELGQLLLLGLLSLLASFAVVIVTVICALAMIGADALSSLASNYGSGHGLDIAQLQRFIVGVFVTLSVAVVLAFCVGAAFWMAPARVILGGRQAIDAIADSFTACMRNWRSLTMFGFGMLGLAVLATLPLLLGFFIWFPVSIAATYVIHRDVFGEDGGRALSDPRR